MTDDQTRLEQYQNILEKRPAMLAAFQSCSKGKNRADQTFLAVFLPVMTEFICWVLDQAVQSGQKRLYFLARDGYLMYQAAQAVCRGKNIPVDCRYLKVSRYAVRSAEYHLMGDACLDRICVGGIDITPEKVMKRAGLTAEEAEETLRRIERTFARDQVLNYSQLQQLKTMLASDSRFLETVRDRAAAHFPEALAYFRQEGLLDGTSFAFVDSGWIGTLQLSIEQLLRTQQPDIRLKGYYFGLYETPTGVGPDQYRGFYFEPRTHIRRKVRFSNCLFETVFSAPDGMTVGYRLAGAGPAAQEGAEKPDCGLAAREGAEKPDCGLTAREGAEKPDCGPVTARESEKKNPNAARIREFEQLTKEYIQAWLKADAANQPEADEAGRHPASPTEARPGSAGNPDCLISDRLLALLMGHPTAEEARSFGDMLFCDDILELQLQPVAARLTDDEVCNLQLLRKTLIVTGLAHRELHESAWIEGTITNNNKAVNRRLRHAALYKTIMYLRKGLHQ